MTTNEAVKYLDAARASAEAAIRAVENLLVPHDYQDVAALTIRAAEALLAAAAQFLTEGDEAAFDSISRSEDLLDAVYETITGDMDADED
ncbi:MAG: hypothetical protein IT298_10325 [Chloroflexi bacterium]|nr:hypothetical protein [Chloroflexota bacterium]